MQGAERKRWKSHGTCSCELTYVKGREIRYVLRIMVLVLIHKQRRCAAQSSQWSTSCPRKSQSRRSWFGNDPRPHTTTFQDPSNVVYFQRRENEPLQIRRGQAIDGVWGFTLQKKAVNQNHPGASRYKVCSQRTLPNRSNPWGGGGREVYIPKIQLRSKGKTDIMGEKDEHKNWYPMDKEAKTSHSHICLLTQSREVSVWGRNALKDDRVGSTYPRRHAEYIEHLGQTKRTLICAFLRYSSLLLEALQTQDLSRDVLIRIW